VKVIRTDPLTATSGVVDVSPATVAIPFCASAVSAEPTDAGVNGPPSCPAGIALPTDFTAAAEGDPVGDDPHADTATLIAISTRTDQRDLM
jgi:hypothetical protein